MQNPTKLKCEEVLIQKTRQVFDTIGVIDQSIVADVTALEAHRASVIRLKSVNPNLLYTDVKPVLIEIQTLSYDTHLKEQELRRNIGIFGELYVLVKLQGLDMQFKPEEGEKAEALLRALPSLYFIDTEKQTMTIVNQDLYKELTAQANEAAQGEKNLEAMFNSQYFK